MSPGPETYGILNILEQQQTLPCMIYLLRMYIYVYLYNIMVTVTVMVNLFKCPTNKRPSGLPPDIRLSRIHLELPACRMYLHMVYIYIYICVCVYIYIYIYIYVCWTTCMWLLYILEQTLPCMIYAYIYIYTHI